MQAFVDELAAEVSPDNTKAVIAALAGVFNFAWVHDLCEDRAPYRGVRLPTIRREIKGRALDGPEQLRLYAAAKEHDRDAGYSLFHPLTRLASGSGARLGELLAVVYDCRHGLDLVGGRLVIAQSVRLVWTNDARRQAAMRISPELKTPGSRAVVPLGPATVEVLRAHRESAQADEGDLVFANPSTGGVLSEWRFRQGWADVKRRSGLEPPRLRFHDLRHTFGSTLLAATSDIVQSSKRMRHSKVSTTLDIYTHELGEDSRENQYDEWLEGHVA
jgi:integrase